MAIINGNGLANLLLGDTDPGNTDDVINGFGGNDTLVGGWGNDALIGGVGTDWADYSVGTDVSGPPGQGVVVNLTTGVATDGWGFTDSLNTIENVKGTEFEDNLIGNSGANRLDGLAGDDILDGRAGNDVLNGGGGADELKGGVGSDVMNGGAGDDVFKWAVGDGVDTFNGGADVDTIEFRNGDFTGLQNTFNAGDQGIEVIADANGASDDIVGDATAQNWDFSAATFVNVDEIRTGDGNDKVVGTAEGDVIYGGAGNDNLSGGGGADDLYGDDGRDHLNGGGDADRLFGGNGNDVLNGGAGDDVLYAQAGVDQLTGGNGSDVFFFYEGEIGNNPLNAEAVTDFEGANEIVPAPGDPQDYLAFDVTNPGAGALTLLDAGSGLYMVSDGDSSPEFLIINTGGDPLIPLVDYAFV